MADITRRGEITDFSPWSGTVASIKEALREASADDGSGRVLRITRIKNAIAGLPDNHPEKSALMREADYL